MKGLFKLLLFSLFLLISSSLFSQNEYEDDNEFVGFNSKKEKKYSEGKRKFNIHLNAGYSMSTIFGRDVTELNDTLNAIKSRLNLDSYQVGPNFSPYGHIDFSFNFLKAISLNVGIKYNNLGWREVAKVTDDIFYLRYRVRYDFHYISNSITLQVHPNKFLSVYAGHTFSFLVKNTIYEKDYQIFNGNVVRDEESTTDFTQVTGVTSTVFLPQFFIGTHFGLDRIRVNLNMTYVSKFIRSDIGFNNIALEAGILFKIFKDYDKL